VSRASVRHCPVGTDSLSPFAARLRRGEPTTCVPPAAVRVVGPSPLRNGQQPRPEPGERTPLPGRDGFAHSVRGTPAACRTCDLWWLRPHVGEPNPLRELSRRTPLLGRDGFAWRRSRQRGTPAAWRTYDLRPACGGPRRRTEPTPKWPTAPAGAGRAYAVARSGRIRSLRSRHACGVSNLRLVVAAPPRRRTQSNSPTEKSPGREAGERTPLPDRDGFAHSVRGPSLRSVSNLRLASRLRRSAS
jgi:hypothetical protein